MPRFFKNFYPVPVVANVNQTDSLELLRSALVMHQEMMHAVLKQLASLQAEKVETQWVSLDEGAKALGPAFSARKIAEDIRAGYLKHGTHYIDTSNGSRPTYAVKVLALRKIYEIPPEKRRRFG